MFLIDAIKPNVENNSKLVFIPEYLGKESQESKNKIGFVSFRSRFISGNKKNNKKTRKCIISKSPTPLLLICC